MTRYEITLQHLKDTQYRWLVTGVAGFIGSGLLEALLKLNQKVIGLDNFSTGHRRNLDQIRELAGEKAWRNFSFV
ncbi:MAG: GDP-mannose 4,6-dehydratase, partial [Betaproteobacteria bacterium]|nr:GDP-mannose 4,6-dehydratase [Betaproteobacteria bacterium]